MQFRPRFLCAGALGALALAFLTPTAARGNAGTQLPLSQYQAGTEQTSLVPNGNFETVTGGQPTGWTPTGDMAVGAPPVNNPVFGSFSAKAVTLASGDADPDVYQQQITFDQTKSYVISAYIWNSGRANTGGSNNNADLALVELRDLGGGTINNVALEPVATDGGNAADGYFVYSAPIAGNLYPSGANLFVKGDLGSRTDVAAAPGVWAQFDNIAITDAATFQPPTQVPEPASLGVLALGGAALLGRRRSRVA